MYPVLLLLPVCIFVLGVPSHSKACKCGELPSSRIYNGKKVPRDAHPWMATLHTVKGDSESLCGAAIIASRYAITAGHCVPVKGGTTYLLAGVYDISNWQSSRNKVKVDRFYVFGSDVGDDIAVVKLKKDVSVQPICLPPTSQTFAGVQATIIGYGEKRNGDTSNIPLGGNVTVPSNSQCRRVLKRFGEPEIITNNVICAGNYRGQPSTCFGDSGSPLMHFDEKKRVWMVIGLVSGSYSCSATNIYGLFCRVSSYVKSIQSYINNAGCQK